MGTNHLSVSVFENLEKAPHYNDEYKLVSLDQAVIVQNGTVEGNSTVDLIFTDKDGKKHVAMITMALLKYVTEMDK